MLTKIVRHKFDILNFIRSYNNFDMKIKLWWSTHHFLYFYILTKNIFPNYIKNKWGWLSLCFILYVTALLSTGSPDMNESTLSSSMKDGDTWTDFAHLLYACWLTLVASIWNNTSCSLYHNYNSANYYSFFKKKKRERKNTINIKWSNVNS